MGRADHIQRTPQPTTLWPSLPSYSPNEVLKDRQMTATNRNKRSRFRLRLCSKDDVMFPIHWLEYFCSKGIEMDRYYEKSAS